MVVILQRSLTLVVVLRDILTYRVYSRGSILAKSDSPGSDKFFMLWIWAAIISTCYTLTLDIKMDWGLLDRKAPQENRFLKMHRACDFCIYVVT